MDLPVIISTASLMPFGLIASALAKGMRNDWYQYFVYFFFFFYILSYKLAIR